MLFKTPYRNENRATNSQRVCFSEAPNSVMHTPYQGRNDRTSPPRDEELFATPFLAPNGSRLQARADKTAAMFRPKMPWKAAARTQNAAVYGSSFVGLSGCNMWQQESG